MSKLIHIADRVLNRPLMLLPEKLALIASVLEGRISIDASELRDIEVDAHLREGPGASRFVGTSEATDGKSKPYRVQNGVAVISILGSLVNRGAWIGARSGMTSYEGIGYQLDTAASDPDVRTVLLDIDSPGGEAVGAFEAADKVRSLAKSKEVVAMINGMAASAAYAIASAATRIVSTPSGVSGSIGVVLMHADYSHALHDKGVKPTLIHAGAHKVDGNPYEPLTENVRADLKAEVDQFYSLFVSGVAKGRKGRMTEKSIRGTEARTYIGASALEAGLVDEIGSFETVLADLSGRSARSSTSNQRKATTMNDMTMFTQVQLDAAVTAARTEATAAANVAAAAAQETAIAAAVTKATADAITAERARIGAIINSDEGKARGAAALSLALSDANLTAEVAVKTLAGLPKSTGVDASGAHGLFLSPDASNPRPAKADHGWGDVISELNGKK